MEDVKTIIFWVVAVVFTAVIAIPLIAGLIARTASRAFFEEKLRFMRLCVKDINMGSSTPSETLSTKLFN